jgi:FkbM family methyltransferase
MSTTSTQPSETLELEIAGRPVRFTFPSAPGLRPFVEDVLRGADYPLVFPGVYRPQTIVDIGAHAGAATVYFKAHYPWATVLAFEPCQNTFDYLLANTRDLDAVHTRRAALGSQDGRARLFMGQHSSMQNSLRPNLENSSACEWVPVLDARAAIESIGHSKVSIVKLDTEGCEIEILESIRTLWPAVEVIYLEYHSEDDRLAIDTLLAPRFVLYAARASVPHRGTQTYLRVDVLERCNELLASRHVFPKDPGYPRR